MTKNSVHLLLIIITVLVVVYYALNLSGILVFSNNPTIANEPNLPLNSKMFSSNLVQPKRGDFIVYNFNDEYLGNHKRIHRLIALGNDTLEIKKGITYLNGDNIDKDLNLVHYYKFDKINLEEIYAILPDYAFNYLQKYDSINLKVLINDSLIKELKFKTTRILNTKEFIDKEIQAIYNKPWNKDNFGPIIIPANKVFILGDNRDNTFDSRNIGFIDEKEIVGVLIGNF